jgi:hypothetical protein
MTVPGRTAAAALLLSLDPPAWFLRHSAAVAEIASWVARLGAHHGRSVDTLLVEAAALLHDVDKIVPPDDPARGMPHGDGSADWLARHDHAELGESVRAHPVTQLMDGAAFDRWRATAPIEAKVVAYADKRAGQRLESMAARFASWERRYPNGWSAAEGAAVRARAADLEAEVCEWASINPGGVRRSPWVADAIRRARRADAA